MRATIKDIAAATGFSVTTISLVLNGKGYKISDETKNQILAKARELNGFLIFFYLDSLIWLMRHTCLARTK